MQHSFPLRQLIRQSGKLVLLFVLASLIIGTSNQSDLSGVLMSALITFVLYGFIFFINIGLLVYYGRQKGLSREMKGKRIFLTGYLAATFLFLCFYLLNVYLRDRGIFLSPEGQSLVERATGWRAYVYLPCVSFIMYSFIFIIQTLIVQQYEKNRIELELLKLKAVNVETANQLLRQQIQPHFLFNALNVLKSLIRKYPQTAEAYLLRLSDFLRASISRNPSGVATVREELKLCDDYMEMQKIRFGNALVYDNRISGNDDSLEKTLPFFSLQPLLENAIKHNELTESHPLTVTLKTEDGYIRVSNNLRKKKTIESASGSGLANLRERYKLLSGDDIVITGNDNAFTVSIKIIEK